MGIDWAAVAAFAATAGAVGNAVYSAHLSRRAASDHWARDQALPVYASFIQEAYALTGAAAVLIDTPSDDPAHVARLQSVARLRDEVARYFFQVHLIASPEVADAADAVRDHLFGLQETAPNGAAFAKTAGGLWRVFIDAARADLEARA